MERIQDDEYMEFKKELMRRKTYPYIFHNAPLARAFYERFKEGVPTARYYEQEEIGQVITHDQRAEKKLCQLIEGFENDYKRKMISLADVRISVESSIRSKETKA